MFSQACHLQYSRDTLLAINNGHRCVALDTDIRDVISRLHLHRRGCRAGDHRRRRDIAAQMVTSFVNTAVSSARQRRCQGIPRESPGKHVRQRAEAVQTLTSSVDAGDSAQPRAIPVIVNNRRSIQRATLYEGRSQKRQPVRMVVRRSSLLPFVKGNGGTSYGITSFPTLYVLNAASIAKPHAIQHLSADLISYNVHIAVITETHLKKRHDDHLVAITGYSLFRRDRSGRKGGGVAVYVDRRMPATVWENPSDSPLFELLWIHVRTSTRELVVGALYHPPQPLYDTTAFLRYIETSVDAIESAFPAALVILAGDFNALPEDDVIARSALCSIVDQPTRGPNKLDRIYVSEPSYTSIKVVTPTGKSDHKAVIAYTGSPLMTANKSREQLKYRRRSPNQHALLLSYLSSHDITIDNNNNVQRNFDEFYEMLNNLLNRFYPQRTITITSTDPGFITPTIKAQLRRKNRLMRAGRVEQAGALAGRIRAAIIRQNRVQLQRVNTRQCAREAWAEVRKFTKAQGKGASCAPSGLTAETFNNHYASVSADSRYRAPPDKQTTSIPCCYVSEMEVFRMLERLKPTTTGLDMVPAWFLRLGAPVFAAPLAQLLNQSVACGIVPQQWKKACITPIPKVASPKGASDYRPISITPVLSRMFERHIVRSYIYEALQHPPPGMLFADQFAFRPTGSTDAALITLLHTISVMLTTQPFVRVFSLDFSKAFDTLRHATLMEKMAQLSLPDAIYNWINDFFTGHSHCTKFQGSVSDFADILASVIQGSAIGPASYIITSSDLQPTHPGNAIVKFADDTYIIVPAANSDSSTSELMHVQSWAEENNLKLNCSKSKEIIFAGRVTRNKSVLLPAPCLGICQVQKITALGVIINDKMTAEDHVSSVLASCSRSLYALRILRDHGLPTSSLQDVFRATVIAKLVYCAPAWSGLCTANDRARLDTFLRRSKRYGYCADDVPVIVNLFAAADQSLFKRVINNEHHVLQPLLTERNNIDYNLRPRNHDRQLMRKSTYINNSLFIVRMLYKDSY